MAVGLLIVLAVVVPLAVWQARNRAAVRETMRVAGALAQHQMGPGQAVDTYPLANLVSSVCRQNHGGW